jgi:Uma2 family endonuclease
MVASAEGPAMTTQPKHQRFTADEFLDWAAEQPNGRFELAGGVLVAMAPETAGHLRVKFAAAKALEAAIAERNIPCEAMIDGMSVRINDQTVYEPDALVRCGARTTRPRDRDKRSGCSG